MTSQYLHDMEIELNKQLMEQFKKEKLLLMKIIANPRNGVETKRLAKEALKQSRLAFRRFLGQEKYEHKVGITNITNELIVQELF